MPVRLIVFNRSILLPILFAGLLPLVFLGSCTTSEKSDVKPGKVEVINEDGRYNLYRNGEPFRIRGVAGHEHLKQLREIGGNTIRTYDTTGLAEILDSAYANDIAVIVGLWMMGDTEMDYTDSFLVANQYEQIRHTVRKYRDHPALLMWCLGNEVSHHVHWKELFFPRDVWKEFANLVDLIHAEDPDHPVTTTFPNYQRKRILYFMLHVPQLDIVAINTFKGLERTYEEVNKFHWLFDKPFFIAEWGVPGPWESKKTPWYTPLELPSSKKAELYEQFHNEYIPHDDPHFLGTCVFYWGHKQEHTHTWFSFFSEHGETSQMYETIKVSWTGMEPQNYVPRVDSLVIEGEDYQDSLIFSPAQELSAHVYFYDPEGDSLHTEWEILPDAWHFDYRAINSKPRVIDGLIHKPGPHEVKFTTPSEPGSYRLFAKVTDPRHHMFGTANIPFLVVE